MSGDRRGGKSTFSMEKILLRLPDNTLQEILRWLPFRDFMQLDLAISQRGLRSTWLSFLENNVVSMSGKMFTLERVPDHRRQKRDRILRFLQERHIGFDCVSIGELSSEVVELIHTSLSPGLAYRANSLEVQVKSRGSSTSLHDQLQLLSDFTNIRSFELSGSLSMEDAEDDLFFGKINQLFPSLRNVKLRFRNFSMTDRNPKIAESIKMHFQNIQKLSIDVMQWDIQTFQTLFVHSSNALTQLENLYLGPIEYPVFLNAFYTGIERNDEMKFQSFCDSLHMMRSQSSSRHVALPKLTTLAGDFLAVYPLLRLYAPQLHSATLEVFGVCNMIETDKCLRAMIKDLKEAWRGNKGGDDHVMSLALAPAKQLLSFTFHCTTLSGAMRETVPSIDFSSFLSHSQKCLQNLSLIGMKYDIRLMMKWFSRSLPGSESSEHSPAFPSLRTFIWRPHVIAGCPSADASSDNYNYEWVRKNGRQQFRDSSGQSTLAGFFCVLGIRCPLLQDLDFTAQRLAMPLPMLAFAQADLFHLRSLTIRRTAAMHYTPKDDLLSLSSLTQLQSLCLEEISMTSVTEIILLQLLPYFPLLRDLRVVISSLGMMAMHSQRYRSPASLRDFKKISSNAEEALNSSREVAAYMRRLFHVDAPRVDETSADAASERDGSYEAKPLGRTRGERMSKSKGTSDSKTRTTSPPRFKVSTEIIGSRKKTSKSAAAAPPLTSDVRNDETDHDSEAVARTEGLPHNTRTWEDSVYHPYFSGELLTSLITHNRKLESVNLQVGFFPEALQATDILRMVRTLPMLRHLQLSVLQYKIPNPINRAKLLRESTRDQLTENEKARVQPIIDCVALS